MTRLQRYRLTFGGQLIHDDHGDWCDETDVEKLEEQHDEARLQIRNLLLLLPPPVGRAEEITREEARKFLGEDA